MPTRVTIAVRSWRRRAPLGALLGCLGLAAALAGCPEPVPTEDAATRADASVIEGGLSYADASPPLGDSSRSDAAPFAPDAALACGGACDPTVAIGCEGDEVCALRADGEPACGASGEAEAGMPCAGPEGCAPGLSCFLAAVSGGVCARPCCPGSSECDEGEVCGGEDLLVDGSRTSFGACRAPRACQLLEERGCATREACYLTGSTGESECLVAGEVPRGGGCARANDCAPGLVCVGAVERACTALCRIGADDACEGSATCVRQAYTPEGVGVCVSAAGRP